MRDLRSETWVVRCGERNETRARFERCSNKKRINTEKKNIIQCKLSIVVRLLPRRRRYYFTGASSCHWIVAVVANLVQTHVFYRRPTEWDWVSVRTNVNALIAAISRGCLFFFSAFSHLDCIFFSLCLAATLNKLKQFAVLNLNNRMI